MDLKVQLQRLTLERGASPVGRVRQVSLKARLVYIPKRKTARAAAIFPFAHYATQRNMQNCSSLRRLRRSRCTMMPSCHH